MNSKCPLNGPYFGFTSCPHTGPRLYMKTVQKNKTAVRVMQAVDFDEFTNSTRLGLFALYLGLCTDIVVTATSK